MYYFDKKQLYYELTGQHFEKYIREGLICDYCGKIYREDPYNDEGHFIRYKIHDLENIETLYHEDKVDPRLEEAGLDLYDVMNVHREFFYCMDYETLSIGCESEVLAYQFRSWPELPLAYTMYQCRWDAIRKLLDQGVSLEELGLS